MRAAVRWLAITAVFVLVIAVVVTSWVGGAWLGDVVTRREQWVESLAAAAVFAIFVWIMRPYVKRFLSSVRVDQDVFDVRPRR
jgi:hypothetical protein